jgi:hypothetical protein
VECVLLRLHALARLDHARRRQVLRVRAKLHAQRRGTRVEVRCLVLLLLMLRGSRLDTRRVQAVGSNVGLVDGGADSDRLAEVGVLAEHGAQLSRMGVLGLLLAPGCRPSVEGAADAVEAGDRAATARATIGGLLLVDLDPAAALAMTGRLGSFLQLHVVEVGLHARQVNLVASSTHVST